MTELKTAIKQLGQLIDGAKTVLVLQPEKPDTDSLTSSLALEQILGELGKTVILYCKDKIPHYISYFEGADRVVDEFPKQYDIAILVDTGGPGQVTRTLEDHQPKLVKKPFTVIDHHPTRESLPFENLEVVDGKATSTNELIFEIAGQLGWKINAEAAQLMIPGILADTRNLSIPTVGAKEFRLVADLIDQGADIFKSHEDFRKINSISVELVKVKGEILSRIESFADGKILFVHITPDELSKYAEIHDPADLVMYEMQRAEGVEVAVVMRHYGGESNKIKVSTRANMPVAGKTCAEFGGGGHDRASGCQFNGTPLDDAKKRFIKALTDNIEEYEALQHAN